MVSRNQNIIIIHFIHRSLLFPSIFKQHDFLCNISHQEKSRITAMRKDYCTLIPVEIFKKDFTLTHYNLPILDWDLATFPHNDMNIWIKKNYWILDIKHLRDLCLCTCKYMYMTTIKWRFLWYLTHRSLTSQV